jgi:cell division control protein 6
VNLAAAITSQENGDARYALKLINKAAEMVQQEKKEKITDADVEAARKKVELDITLETINTLPEMHQLVLYAIASLTSNGSKYSRLEGTENTGMLLSGEVYEEYERACKMTRKRPRSSRWYKEYLNDLEVLGLIITTPSGKGVRGQTTLIRLGPHSEQVLEILKKNLFGS